MNEERKILNEFHSKEKKKYNELKKELPSNKFSYYLKKLIDKGYIEKKDEFYKITFSGECYLLYLDQKNDSLSLKQPIIDVFLIGVKGNKILFQERGKMPFKGIAMPIGSRVREGKSLFETAENIFYRDTGLKGRIAYKGIIDVKSMKEGNLFVHHILHVFKIDKIKGKLKEKTSKGLNYWLSEKDYLKKKNIFKAAKEQLAFAKSKGPLFLELIQYIDQNGKFIGNKIIRNDKL
ncbi:MAG: hypothetical protein KKB31_03125 [Nanoarchaeota archaeon]|nr:hypothetical protein [Nanoarchaeota archaeon]